MKRDELLALKREVEYQLAQPASALGVMQRRFDTGQANGFLRSLGDVPVRTLPQVFGTSAPALVKAARRGKSLTPQVIASVGALSVSHIAGTLTAQGEETPEPLMSVGYSTVGPEDYRAEIRMQNPNVGTILLAQDIAQRAKGEVCVAEYVGLAAHAVPGSPSGGSAILEIGSSIGHMKSPAGTIGLFVRSPDGVGILSNSHVLAWCGRAKLDDDVFAPHPNDSKSHKAVGRLRQFNSLINGDPVSCDAAFALLADGVNHNSNIIPKGMAEAGRAVVAARGALEFGRLKVSKVGRTSRQTFGKLSAQGVDPQLHYPSLGDVKLTGMMEILWTDTEDAFSKPGDSGSVVYRPDTMEAIGLIVGGGIRVVDGVDQGVSIVCPIGPITKEWELSLV